VEQPGDHHKKQQLTHPLDQFVGLQDEGHELLRGGKVVHKQIALRHAVLGHARFVHMAENLFPVPFNHYVLLAHVLRHPHLIPLFPTL